MTAANYRQLACLASGPQCRFRHLTTRCIRRHGRLAIRLRGQYTALLPVRELCPQEHLEPRLPPLPDRGDE